MSAYSCCLESHSKLSTFRGTAEWPGGEGGSKGEGKVRVRQFSSERLSKMPVY